jgi:hypothetical protein
MLVARCRPDFAVAAVNAFRLIVHTASSFPWTKSLRAGGMWHCADVGEHTILQLASQIVRRA